MVGLTLVGFFFFGSLAAPPTAAAASRAAAANTITSQAATGQVVQAAVPAGCQAPASPQQGTSSGNGQGDTRFYTYYGQPLDDRLTLKVNVADGDLVAHANDLHIRGTGLDLSIQRFFNSKSNAWTFSFAPSLDVSDPSSQVTFNAADGYAATFTNSGGVYADAPGLDATLTAVSGGYALSFHKTGECLSFNGSGQLTTDSDKNGNKITYAYNASGQVSSITDTQGRVTSIAYTTVGKKSEPTTITDPIGRTVQYTWAAYVVGDTCPPTGCTNFAYEITKVTDANNAVTTFGYYTGGLQGFAGMKSITDPDGHTTTISLNGSTQVASITDATNATTTFSYGNGTGCASGTTGNVVTDANSHATTYCSDSNDLVKKVIDANGHSRSSSYTTDYNVATTTDPLTNTTQFTWSTDGKNNMQSVSDATGAKESFGYSDSSHPYYPNSSTDAQGNTLAYTYDSPGNLTQTQDGLATQNTIKYTYNGNGTIATATDADGNVTHYGYDTKGNLTSETPPSPLGQTTLAYDGASRVTSVTDGKGQVTHFTYDNDDRITKITYNDNATVQYTYDGDGNVLTEVDNTGTTTFTYDNDNRNLTKILPASQGGATISYTYDPVGNLASLTDPNGTVGYAYDKVNNLTTLTEPNSQQVTFQYDNDDRRTLTSYPNGVTQTITYDKAGRETSIVGKHGSTTLTSFTYCYVNTYPCPTGGTPTNLRYYISDVSGNVGHVTYDTLNRVTETSVANGGTQIADEQFQYDGVGNRTASTSFGPSQPNTTVSYSYNAANELTSNAVNGGTPTSYSYDGNGNLTGSSAGLAIAYNAKNQTTSMTVNGATTSFGYTGTDQTERVSTTTASGTEAYLNTALGVTRETGPSGLSYERDNRGGLVSKTPDGANYFYYLLDGQGSVVGITDPSGNLAQTYAYGTFGQVIQQSGGLTNPWRYVSGYSDDSTGYEKLGARYYDPTLGRWTQQDPIAGSLSNPASQCRYVYAQDDPWNLSDPGGLCTWSDLFGNSLILVGSIVVGVGATLATPVTGVSITLAVGSWIVAFGAAWVEGTCLAQLLSAPL